ncbi:MAG: MarR family winged helix-turn-helix transcriptional regulator [Acidobacteriota bacterium]|jgi:DNA-binding MarR family transcriptional regulator|nr:MarR family winged helix-turn-helix transcriptional regulator [Acidobacteriota bacterium]
MAKKKQECEHIKIARAIAEDCLAVRIRFLGRVVTGLYDRALQGLDIKTNQATILVFLTLHPGASPAKVGRALQMEKSTVSRGLERMRKKGWIEIASGATPGGARGTLAVRVTADGGRLLASLHREWQKAQEEAQALLGDEGVRAARRIFDVLKRRGYAAGSDL